MDKLAGKGGAGGNDGTDDGNERID